jgi:2',3'-cyclic-nucleotide 2'-phosphodiesterase (5'-nucleotidase family)
LHTNDFHGRLETDYRGRGGSAYMASVINDIRAAKGEENVALMDAGDVYFAAPAISQLLMGESTIDIYNLLGYDLAAFGNHEFDKGQDELTDRVAQSEFPWLGANVVLEGTDWDLPDWAQAYEILELGVGPDMVNLGVLGLAGEETPNVTLLGTTDGLVFKDLTETILHYYDDVMAQADALVVVVHMGTDDSGPYDGLTTVAQNLIDAGKPVDLMIGGHQHQALFTPVYVGDTAIVSAGYYGRWLGQIDVTIDKTAKSLSVDNYQLNMINNTLPADPAIEAQVAYWAEIVAPIVNQPVGATNIDLWRDYNDESVVGDIVTDSMLWKADEYDDGEVNGSVDIAFTNPGGLRADILIPEGATLPYTITWGMTFDVLPFGNTLYLMDLTGAQIQTLLDQSANLYKGILQTSGADWYWYNNSDDPDIAPTSWGAYGVTVDGEPLDRDEVYRVVTNNFLAGGQDGWTTFAEGTNRWDTYYDMQQGFVEYIEMLEVIDADDVPMDRITRLDNVVTMLHTNDTHGRWSADYYGGGMVYLADLIAKERAHNPDVLLLDAGDTFQGNSFAYFFKDRPDNPIAGGMNLLNYDAITIGNHEFNFGPTTFETMLSQVNFPLLGAANMDDDGSYGTKPKIQNLITDLDEFRTNGEIKKSGIYNSLHSKLEGALAKLEEGNPKAAINKLQAFINQVNAQSGKHITSDAAASLLMDAEEASTSFINSNIQDYITLDVDGKKVVIFGLTNPRIYRYELPTNIPGLTFYPAVDTAMEFMPELLSLEPDLLVGLTHVGYQPYGGEFDSDELIAQSVAGFDVLIGGHSHTYLNPAVIVADPDNNPNGTLVAHARRYAGYLGKVNVGWIDGEIVLREGYLIPTSEATPDPALEAYLTPFEAEINAYNNTVIGESLVDIDGSQAYTEETNSANLQADSAVWELMDKTATAIDLHLSGAMTNASVSAGILTKGDMFNLMRYENSLVVFEMNGPQIKTILERSYRNWWWYNQGYPWGGYSHYTTCMLATDSGNVITYSGDLGTEPDGNNVVSLAIDGVSVDFTDAGTTYLVSTVNYVAAGSCNFNNDGVTLWPLDQIVLDSQLYVRDSVISYVETQPGPIAPAVEGRLQFPVP